MTTTPNEEAQGHTTLTVLSLLCLFVAIGSFAGQYLATLAGHEGELINRILGIGIMGGLGLALVTGIASMVLPRSSD